MEPERTAAHSVSIFSQRDEPHEEICGCKGIFSLMSTVQYWSAISDLETRFGLVIRRIKAHIKSSMSSVSAQDVAG